MAWTIKQALADKSITLVKRRIYNEYQFTVGELKTIITIRTYKETEHGAYLFEQSHNIKTPVQISAYHTSRPWADYEAYAVHLAISGITQYYNEAVKAGHKPKEFWLIPNKRFVNMG